MSHKPDDLTWTDWKRRQLRLDNRRFCIMIGLNLIALAIAVSADAPDIVVLTSIVGAGLFAGLIAWGRLHILPKLDEIDETYTDEEITEIVERVEEWRRATHE